MRLLIRMFTCVVFLLSTHVIKTQTITINQSTQRYLGSVSELDRSKYFVLHSGSNDTELDAFSNEFNVTKGRQFWGPFSYARSQTGVVGQYPPYQNGGTGLRAVQKGIVATEHPYNVIRYNLSMTAAADWAVEYYKDFVDNNGRPEFFEPMNEPFVHAGDADFSAQQPDRTLMTERMADWFGEIGKKIHQAPELDNMKVIGYSSAWPSLERWDFGHWNQYQKMFMDRAGLHMDAFSTHLYDGINVTGQDNLRSGSNSEAILDMIEAYSFIKWGTVKPHAITEYGGIASGYGSNYSDVESVQSVKSFNNIIFNLLERQDKMLISIPFATDKSTWHLTAGNNYQPYGAVILRPSNLGQPNPAGWVYTPKVYFYDLWQQFKGNRVDISSSNPDIQCQAFVDGNKMYIAVNNVHTSNQTVSLNFADGLSGLQNVRIKRLKIYSNQDPVWTNNVQNSAPSSLTLIPNETVTLEYTFNSAISFDNAIRSKKYYTNKYLQSITSTTAVAFNFNGVSTGSGRAFIRMSIGRKHNVSKSPVVKVNGTTVAVPGNWAGYDQANRDDFFGTIMIPVPMNLLTNNNTVTVQFPDNGGHIASMILQVEKYDNAPTAPTQSPYNGIARSIPGTIEAEEFDLGGQGVAYNDSDPSNQGPNVMRENEGVDIESRDGGNSIGWTANGEWLEYTVNATAGIFDVDLRIATTSLGKSVVAKLDGATLGTFNLPNTGGWGAFQTVNLPDISVSGGSGKILRLEFVGGGVNLNWVKFTANATVESVDCNSFAPPLASSTSIPISVDYVSGGNRDVVLELWKGSTFLDVKTVPVGAGSGTASANFSLANAPVPGTDYVLKASIRPTGGDWTTSIDACNKGNVTVITTLNPTVNCNSFPPSLASSTSIPISVDYTADQSRDVVMELWKGPAYITEKVVPVTAGSGTASSIFALTSAPVPANDYILKASIRPTGGDWTTSLDACSRSNVTVCNLPWTTANISVNAQTVNYTSPPINISCVNTARISMNVEGLTPAVMETADYLNVYYAVDGGSQIPISENTDGFALKTVSASNISGNSVVIYINGKTSWTDETYNVSNIIVEDDNASLGSADQVFLHQPTHVNASVIELERGGIEELEMVKVFPNPLSKGHALNITLGHPGLMKEIELVDMMGKVISTHRTYDSQWTLEDQPCFQRSGMLMIKIKHVTRKGAINSIYKLVIE